MTIRFRTGSPARLFPAGLVALLVALSPPIPAAAQDAGEQEEAADEAATGWTGTGELSVVATAGNTETSSFAGRLETERTWVDGTLRLQAEALRAERTVTDRRAIGVTPEAVRIVESESTEVTAESFGVGAEYDRELSRRLFAFGWGSWERDEPSGIADRWVLGGGFGHRWIAGEDRESRTTYGVTVTRETTTIGLEKEFAGLRLAWDYRRALTPTTTYAHALVVNENLEDTDDLRAGLRSSIAVSMTERLALKVGVQLEYDAQPAFERVQRELPDGAPTGDTVTVELEPLDTVLSVALVVRFQDPRGER